MFTLRLPFELPTGYQITDTDKPIQYANLECKLKKESRAYALIIKGFCTEEDAEYFLSNSWSGLMWVLLNCGLAPLWETKLQKISYTKDPVAKEIDGLQPAIFSSDGSYWARTTDNINLISGTNTDRFFEYFFKGIEYKNWENGFKNNKLRIALELYGAFFSEATENARFLTLVMVLEALSESEKRPDMVLDLLINFRGQIEDVESNYSKESNERVSLESLKRELTFRKEDSIRKQIRSLVFNTLSNNGDVDALEMAKQALKVYDKRSTLVHGGSLTLQELGSISSEARIIVERVLRAKFIQMVDECNI